MENFDKIKEVVIKCIKREYDNCTAKFTYDGKIYRLDVHIFKTSPSAQLKCVQIIEQILQLCHIKEPINISVNGRSRLVIQMDVICENLNAMRNSFNEQYEIPDPRMINSTYGGYIHNTDPIIDQICQ
jgi:hypothetical protein